MITKVLLGWAGSSTGCERLRHLPAGDTKTLVGTGGRKVPGHGAFTGCCSSQVGAPAGGELGKIPVPGQFTRTPAGPIRVNLTPASEHTMRVEAAWTAKWTQMTHPVNNTPLPRIRPQGRPPPSGAGLRSGYAPRGRCTCSFSPSQVPSAGRLPTASSANPSRPWGSPTRASRPPSGCRFSVRSVGCSLPCRPVLSCSLLSSSPHGCPAVITTACTRPR